MSQCKGYYRGTGKLTEIVGHQPVFELVTSKYESQVVRSATQRKKKSVPKKICKEQRRRNKRKVDKIS
jgi:hypothetical protein